MNRPTLLALLLTSTLSATALASAAIAAPQPQRVRGTVVSVAADSIVVHPATGADVSVAVGPDTRYSTVVKSSLDKVEKGSYIGTATKSVGDKLVALEVVVFPPAMRGTGDGHYPWDKITDTTLAGGTGATASSMTNGNVDAAAPAGGARQTSSAMTNGNVDAASDKSGAREITVSYKDGKQTILVPPTAPIVTFQPADMSVVKKGATVFVSGTEDGGKVTARAVAVGTPGVNPPM